MPPGIFCIDHARTAAKRRVPRMLFDFVDGAAGAEQLKQENETVINQIRLQPRVLVNVENPNLDRTFLGKRWSLPIGVAPMGMCNLTWPGADDMLARACVKHNIPLGLSTAASSTIEDMAKRAEGKVWFQLYVGQSEDAAFGFVDRAANAGVDVLMLTVDVPQVAPRFRDLRNGFKTPFKIGPKQFLDFALHPQWSISTLMNGTPRTANYESDTGEKSFVRGESRGRVDFEFLKRLRDKWKAKLIVKGVLHPDDAVRIKDAGADAVYISNHGGRQLDSALPAIEVLPRIREDVGDDYPLMFDSGVRSGEGVIKALALGADFVMLGRPFMYGIGADGERGLETVITLLKSEIELTLAQLGKTNIDDVDQSVIFKT